MSDIAIPADDAKRLADYLRNFHFHGMSEEQDRLIALLDPPAPSLRDEVGEYVVAEMLAATEDTRPSDIADRILAVVRRHVEALPRWLPETDGMRALDRDDVLRLLNGGSDD